MWPDTRIQNLFGIEVPIIQAPMAGANRAEMAIAVAEAGALGSLPGRARLVTGVTALQVDPVAALRSNGRKRCRDAAVPERAESPHRAV